MIQRMLEKATDHIETFTGEQILGAAAFIAIAILVGAYFLIAALVRHFRKPVMSDGMKNFMVRTYLSLGGLSLVISMVWGMPWRLIEDVCCRGWAVALFSVFMTVIYSFWLHHIWDDLRLTQKGNEKSGNNPSN